jgi:hypothetical protein
LKDKSDMSSWSKEFDEPIILPEGGCLATLRDAGDYIAALPNWKHQRQEWQRATEFLLMAVDDRMPMRIAYIALLRALRHAEPAKSRGRRA